MIPTMISIIPAITAATNSVVIAVEALLDVATAVVGMVQECPTEDLTLGLDPPQTPVVARASVTKETAETVRPN